ncbi:MAG TPA: purine-nucleoside phosphorylase [bacterium]|nr:purine-nucleoside phosphorylase [bacterium]
MSAGTPIADAVAEIRRRTPLAPPLGVIFGSGLGALADQGEAEVVLPYGEIPHFPVPTAAGHRGRLILGRLGGRACALMQGRVHVYEGYTAAQVVFPVRVLAALGVRTLIVTNAAGGIAPGLRAGDLMVITDHINFSGTNPLIGPNDETLGPRFPDLSRAYDPALVALAVEVARAAGMTLQRGVYIGVSGPSYETPAELAMMARWGADAVGMSTIPEVIAARHAGVRVLGLSAITNAAAGGEAATHEAVLRAAHALEPRFVRLVRGIIETLPG